jgi:thioredoxin reductase
MPENQQHVYDVVVIGGGAAGLSAAVTLATARRSVMVVDAGSPRNAASSAVHGFLSREGTSPLELLAAGREELRRRGGELTEGTAVAASGNAGEFTVRLQDGRTLTSRRLLIASGFRDELPDVAGVKERWGRDVVHCPYCHGWDLHDRAVGVLATEPAAAQEALLFRQWSQDITLFQHAMPEPSDMERKQLAARSIRIIKGRVKALHIVEDVLTAVILESGRLVPCGALVVSPKPITDSPLLQSLGLQEADPRRPSNHHVKTDESGGTAVPGVWAAGNIADPEAQVITAASSGVKAASAINADLVAEDTRYAVMAAQPDLSSRRPDF